MILIRGTGGKLLSLTECLPKTNFSHMKKFIILLLSFGFSAILTGQDTDLRVAASAGASFSTNDFSLDWTLGEVMIETMENTSMMLSNGFHQPDYTLVSVKPIAGKAGLRLVLPNPFSDELNIKMSCADIERGLFRLYSITGNPVWEKSFSGKEVVENYASAALPAGPYILAVSFTNDPLVYSYMLLKIP